MFDVQFNEKGEAVLFEDNIEVLNLETIRDKDGHIRYNFPDGRHIEIWANNTIVWCDSAGEIHRDGDMPAFIRIDGYMAYCNHGNTHRINGPARIWRDGTVEYWIDGEYYTNEDYEMAKRNA